MRNYALDKKEQKDRIKSGIITSVIWGSILLFLFLYKITDIIPVQSEAVSTMLINFGDNRNGDGLEEPANQEGSLIPNNSPEIAQETSVEEAVAEPAQPKEKIILGNNTKVAAPKKTATKANPTNNTANTSTKTTSQKNTKATATKNAQGDGRGTAAVGNLIRGRGNKPGSQGVNGTTGNAGDPVGGDGDGDSRIGIDRKLSGYIPGTMGRGGSQPKHDCTASGTITISYVVDRAGNVTSARRSGGISDPCVARTSVEWVKRYVKAERANTSSTGTYRISF